MPAVREAVLKLVTHTLSLRQEQALVSWAEDVQYGVTDGQGLALKDSKLLKHVNAGEFQLAAAEFPRWCLVGGKIDPAALTRRINESRMFRR